MEKETKTIEGLIQELTALIKEEVILLRQLTTPIGAIQAFALTTPPCGWLICDGKEYLIEQYPLLYKAIGTTFGGDGKNSFKIPDLQGRFIRGWDSIGNTDPEREFGSFQEDTIQGHSHKVIISAEKIKTSSEGKHRHSVGQENYLCYERNFIHTEYTHSHLCNYSSGFPSCSTDYDGSHTHELSIEPDFITIQNVDSSTCGIVRQSVETRPQNIALLYCIKAIIAE